MHIQLTLRVDRLVIEHLSVQGRPNSSEVGQIQGEGSVVSGVQTKFEPSSWYIWHIRIHKKWIRNEKVKAHQVGVKNLTSWSLLRLGVKVGLAPSIMKCINIFIANVI